MIGRETKEMSCRCDAAVNFCFHGCCCPKVCFVGRGRLRTSEAFCADHIEVGPEPSPIAMIRDEKSSRLFPFAGSDRIGWPDWPNETRQGSAPAVDLEWS